MIGSLRVALCSVGAAAILTGVVVGQQVPG
jgi:hypothetical protein